MGMSRTHSNLAPLLVDTRRFPTAADSILANFYR